MRGFELGFVLTVAVLLPRIGNAQVFQFRTPPPDVSAAAAPWQIDGSPIVVGGLTYYPTRGFRLFDGQIMAQTGMFEGVPVYSDTTIEPYSEIYVPLNSGRMRVYERRRERELAGTTGSHTPTFPVDSPSVPAPRERIVTTSTTEGAVGTGGTTVPRAASDHAVLQTRTRPRRTVITPVQNGVANGVWLEFNGARWYSNGSAEVFTPDRFEPVGEYHGFPVYRDKTSTNSDIWVAVVKDGPVAPYRRQ
jgi:hypothetical protein